jgi:hypothetical protein
MDKITNELTSPSWWFSVVIAGLLINMISAYLKEAFDSWAAGLSVWARSKSEARIQAWNQLVASVGASSKSLNEAFQQELRLRVNACFYLLLAACLYLLLVRNIAAHPAWLVGVALFSCVISAFWSASSVIKANRISEAIKAAKKSS